MAEALVVIPAGTLQVDDVVTMDDGRITVERDGVVVYEGD